MSSSHRAPGLSWKDVQECLEHLQKEAQCAASVEIYTASLGIYKTAGLVVKLTLTVTEGGGGRGCQRVYKRNWPTYHVRTMPGLILAMAHDALEDIAGRPMKVGKQLKSGAYPLG